MMVGKLDIHMQKNKVRPLLYLIHKISSKWIIDLNVRAKTMKLLEENININLFDIRISNSFLYMAPKAQAIKTKHKLNFIKI